VKGQASGKDMEVGGRVDIDGSLSLTGTMEIGGRADIRGEITSRNLEIGGALRARKVMTQEHVEVGGSINTGEGVVAHSVEIGNRAVVHGSVRAQEIDVGRDAEVEDLYGGRIILRGGVSASNVYGESLTIESHCQIRGEVQYTKDLRQGDYVSYAHTPKKVDSLSQ